jgi:hypothetical protein
LETEGGEVGTAELTVASGQGRSLTRPLLAAAAWWLRRWGEVMLGWIEQLQQNPSGPGTAS